MLEICSKAKRDIDRRESTAEDSELAKRTVQHWVTGPLNKSDQMMEMYPVHIPTVKSLVRASAKFRQISVKFR